MRDSVSTCDFCPSSNKNELPAQAADESVDGMQLVFRQNALEKEGKYLEKAMNYEDAERKYLQAIDMGKTQTPRPDYGRPTMFYARVLQKEGRYSEALETFLEFSKQQDINDHFEDRIRELESLLEYQSSGTAEPVYQYLKTLREKYKHKLPPNGLWSGSEITTIIRLYDTIGDHDAGIAFIDEILAWAYENEPALEPLRDHRIKTAGEAVECASKDKPVEERDPNWRGCSWLAEYLLVREAFEKDKVEGTKGRATQALIQSDHFPW